MKPQFRAQLRIPPKDEPYKQADMDAAIGHPIKLNMGAQIDRKNTLTMLIGTVTAAVIESDGSALITMEVTAR